MVNRSLGSLLRCLVGDYLRSWDDILSFAEFAYNSSTNKTIGLSPFEIVTCYKPKAPIDLIPMSTTHRPSEFAFVFVQQIHSLHEIRRKIIFTQ